MLIETGLTIAYKCSCCGSYEFFNTSLFAMTDRRGRTYKCRCNKSCLTAKAETGGKISVYMPCIGCGREHLFVLEKNVLKSGTLSVLNCPGTGTKICFIGKDKDVRIKVDKTEKELDELIDNFGYDSYFQNTQVMLDTLNKIHDIAEFGNLFCECGNYDVELALLPDRVLLKCKKCEAVKVIRAASNEDLKTTMMKQFILIGEENSQIDEEKPYTFIKD